MDWIDTYSGELFVHAICAGFGVITREPDYKGGTRYHWMLTHPDYIHLDIGGYSPTVSGAKLDVSWFYKERGIAEDATA